MESLIKTRVEDFHIFEECLAGQNKPPWYKPISLFIIFTVTPNLSGFILSSEHTLSRVFVQKRQISPDSHFYFFEAHIYSPDSRSPFVACLYNPYSWFTSSRLGCVFSFFTSLAAFSKLSCSVKKEGGGTGQTGWRRGAQSCTTLWLTEAPLKVC